VLEVCANGGVWTTCRIYPTHPDATGVEVFSPGSAVVEALEMWEMGSISGLAEPEHYRLNTEHSTLQSAGSMAAAAIHLTRTTFTDCASRFHCRAASATVTI